MLVNVMASLSNIFAISSILLPLGVFCGHFSIFLGLVYCGLKNLATLISRSGWAVSKSYF
jgi:hypothetical protein